VRGTLRRGGVQHERMSELQRGRIVTAAAETLVERGCSAITVEEIAGRAGVSRKTFYEHFEEREGCLIAALEAAGTNGAQVRHARNPVNGLGRVTYRTLSVLEAVARCPGANNRKIARLAGLTDESHISRILRRLEGLGVLARDGGPAHAKRSRGEPNAWRLTAWGEEVRKAVGGPPARVPAAGK
jgi:AcrR family transcriptional regulator